VEAELETIIEAYKKLHNERGWDVPSIEYIAASCGPFVVLNDFLERHARPTLARFEAVCTAASQGAPLPQPFRPEEVTWVLAGCNWQNLKARPA